MVELFLRKRERFFQEGHGPFVMKRQQGPGRFLHFLFLRRLGLGQKLGIPRAGIVTAQFPGFVEHVLQHLSVHGTSFFLHVAGKSGQQAFQVSPGAQAFQKSPVFFRIGSFRHGREGPHGRGMALFRSPGKCLNSQIPPFLPARIVLRNGIAQGKGQLTHARQQDRFGIPAVLLQGSKSGGRVFLQPVRFDEGKLGQGVLVPLGCLLFQRRQITLQIFRGKIRNRVQGRHGIHISLFRQLAAVGKPSRVLRPHGGGFENSENPVGVRHHQPRCRMPGLLRRFLEKALHMLQAGQRQVAPVQVIKPHPVLPCQHIGAEIARQGLVEKFSVSPPSVHGQSVQMRWLNLSGFSGRRLR